MKKSASAARSAAKIKKRDLSEEKKQKIKLCFCKKKSLNH